VNGQEAIWKLTSFGFQVDRKRANRVCTENSKGLGIGVVGRSMGGLAVEPDAVEKMVGEPVGVLGHSMRTDQAFGVAEGRYALFRKALPQLRLIPSAALRLPTKAKICDLFIALVPADPTGAGPEAAALFICTRFFEGTPFWQQVQLGLLVAGGSRLG